MPRHLREFTVASTHTSPLLGEAFGLDIGHVNKVVDVLLPDTLPLITLITGESGCGKSTLLRILSRDYKSTPIPTTPLWSWGGDEIYTLQVLSSVGLGDAILFAAAYDTLSDSQQARARIALEILNGAECLCIDEFLSTLDRQTAFAVATCLSKALRRLNFPLLCATAHDDIIPYLRPDLVIHGVAFPSRWHTEIPSYSERPFNIKIHERDAAWYRTCDLALLHYRGKWVGGPKEYLQATVNGREVGLLVGKIRSSKGGRRIARVVTHPSYRGIGVGVALIRHYLKMFPDADTVAAMAQFNPVFERAGMRRVKDSVSKSNPELAAWLQAHQFNESLWWSRSYCLAFCQTLSIHRPLAALLARLAGGYRIAPGGKKRLTFDEANTLLLKEAKSCGRVLYDMRPHTMAKFVGPSVK